MQFKIRSQSSPFSKNPTATPSHISQFGLMPPCLATNVSRLAQVCSRSTGSKTVTERLSDVPFLLYLSPERINLIFRVRKYIFIQVGDIPETYNPVFSRVFAVPSLNPRPSSVAMLRLTSDVRQVPTVIL